MVKNYMHINFIRLCYLKEGTSIYPFVRLCHLKLVENLIKLM